MDLQLDYVNPLLIPFNKGITFINIVDNIIKEV